MSIFVGRQTPQTRLRIWAQHAPFIQQHMRAIAEEAKHDYFEYLYVHRDDEKRTVQLFAGHHPISTEADGRLQSEGGATLVLSQDTTFGHVATFIYPYEASRGTAKPILWGVFDSPADAAADKWLDRAVQDFARCCRASSIVDPTVYRSDRFRMRWLQLRSSWLHFRGRLPGCTQLIRAKPSWARWAIGGAAALLFPFIDHLSSVSTLAGFSVPAVWEKLHSQPSTLTYPSPSAASVASSPLKAISTQVVPDKALSVVGAEMPVISGRYTYCPATDAESSPKLLNFLYDVRAHAGKVAFFNVQMSIDCVLGKEPDYEARFGRREDSGGVGYFFQVPLVGAGDLAASRKWIDGKRDLSILYDMYSDNGSVIALHSGDDSRNPISHFQPHVEGSVDILFGPYAIKESEDDAVITFDLNAQFLDTAALQQATAIAKRIRGS